MDIRKIGSRVRVRLAAMLFVISICGSSHVVRATSDQGGITLQKSSTPIVPPTPASLKKEPVLRKTGYALMGVGGSLLVTSIFVAAFADKGIALPYPGQCNSQNGLFQGECVIDARPIYIPGLILGTGMLGTGIGLTVRFR